MVNSSSGSAKPGEGSLLEHISTDRPAGREFVLHESPEGFGYGSKLAKGLLQPRCIFGGARGPWGPVEVTWEGGPGDELSRSTSPTPEGNPGDSFFW